MIEQFANWVQADVRHFVIYGLVLVILSIMVSAAARSDSPAGRFVAIVRNGMAWVTIATFVVLLVGMWWFKA